MNQPVTRKRAVSLRFPKSVAPTFFSVVGVHCIYTMKQRSKRLMDSSNHTHNDYWNASNITQEVFLDAEQSPIVDECSEISSAAFHDASSTQIEKTRRIHPRNCFGLFPDEKHQFSPTRVYQIWPGKNVFFFHGRIMFGPDPRGFLLTATSILLSDWIFCSYIDDIPPQHYTLVFTLSSVFMLTVIASLVLASTRDPGIIPRNEKSPLEEEEEEGGGDRIRRTRSRRINIDGIEMKLKYCKICMIFRPPRSCHCSACDNCVEKFDHHCPWIGQCIGLRNYRNYMMFLFSAIVFFAYMFVFSWWRIRTEVSVEHCGVFKTVIDMPETLVLLLFSFFAVWFVGGLAIFHVYLIIANQTAHENFKYRYAKSPNPYDKGILCNIKEALFTRLPPSRVNFRAVVEPTCNSVARITSMNLANKINGDEILTLNEELPLSTQIDRIRVAESPERSNVVEHLVEIESK